MKKLGRWVWELAIGLVMAGMAVVLFVPSLVLAIVWLIAYVKGSTKVTEAIFGIFMPGIYLMTVMECLRYRFRAGHESLI